MLNNCHKIVEWHRKATSLLWVNDKWKWQEYLRTVPCHASHQTFPCYQLHAILIFQILQESIRIPGSALHLMYQSSQAPGYLSRVLMRLTHATIPPTLTHVHVRVEIEGSVHTKTYEADPHLMHTFAWNKRNVYKQKVSFST